MFDKYRRNSAAARLLEEQLYEQVVNELSNGQKRNGLWAKALANSDGAEEKAKALYIKYRVQSIKDEIEVSEALNEEKLKEEAIKTQQNNESAFHTFKLELKQYNCALGESPNGGYVLYAPDGNCLYFKTINELKNHFYSKYAK